MAGSTAGPVPPLVGLMLHENAVFKPRPAHRSFAHSYLLRRGSAPHHDRVLHPPSVLPPLSSAEAAHLISVAVGASAVTALSLESLKAAARGWNNTYTNSTEPSDKDEDIPLSPPPAPTSVPEIWAAAWAGLEDTTTTSSNTVSGDGTLPTDARLETPLLWIQGLRGDARRRLIALSLAALETRISQLPPNVVEEKDGSQLCMAAMKQSSVLAAATWLGYVPASLEQACKEEGGKQGNLVDSTTRNKLSSEDIENETAGEFSSPVTWFAVEERLGVYCSVLRLLRSSSISPYYGISDYEQNKQDGQEAAATLGNLRTTATASISALCNQRTIVSDASRSVLGWRATQAGTRSQSQLLDLAPSVVQDMAVRIADAVAAAYLAEAAQGSWNPSPIGNLGFDVSRLRNKINAGEGIFRENQEGSALGVVKKYSLVSIYSKKATSSLFQQQSAAVPLEASWWPVFSHPRLASTRQLQRFANRLLVARWLDTAFHSVAAIYDDRLPLFTLAAPGGMVRIRQAPVRRAAQLSALKGVRYAVSLLLEAVDATAPTLRLLWNRATEALAWLLTYVIGKGIGMVWKGLKIGLTVDKRGKGGGTGRRSARQWDGGRGGEGTTPVGTS